MAPAFAIAKWLSGSTDRYHNACAACSLPTGDPVVRRPTRGRMPPAAAISARRPTTTGPSSPSSSPGVAAAGAPAGAAADGASAGACGIGGAAPIVSLLARLEGSLLVLMNDPSSPSPFSPSFLSGLFAFSSAFSFSNLSAAPCASSEITAAPTS